MTTETLFNQLSDFRLTRRGIEVRKTGHYIPLELNALIDLSRIVFFDRARSRAAPIRTDKLRICFSPDKARPWYFARAIAERLGAVIVDDIADADLVWAFDDATFSDPIDTGGIPAMNAACTDISKSRVSEANEIAFGVPLSVDPEKYRGLMVEKSEINGAHDGQVVMGPAPRLPGMVYQRLVDNRIDDGRVEDLRTTIMGGRPVLVFKKRRSAHTRFKNSNSEVILTEITEVFTTEEMAQISAFARAIGLDAGGVDVLRDRETGELAIVDANKTDMGPPLALPLADKIEATRKMAEALDRFLITHFGFAEAPNPKAGQSVVNGLAGAAG